MNKKILFPITFAALCTSTVSVLTSCGTYFTVKTVLSATENPATGDNIQLVKKINNDYSIPLVVANLPPALAITLNTFTFVFDNPSEKPTKPIANLGFDPLVNFEFGFYTDAQHENKDVYTSSWVMTDQCIGLSDDCKTFILTVDQKIKNFINLVLSSDFIDFSIVFNQNLEYKMANFSISYDWDKYIP